MVLGGKLPQNHRECCCVPRLWLQRRTREKQKKPVKIFFSLSSNSFVHVPSRSCSCDRADELSSSFLPDPAPSVVTEGVGTNYPPLPPCERTIVLFLAKKRGATGRPITRAVSTRTPGRILGRERSWLITCIGPVISDQCRMSDLRSPCHSV